MYDILRRDHYRGGGGPERSRYTREDTIQKIPRLSKKNPPRPSPSGGPPKEIGERRGVDEVRIVLCFSDYRRAHCNKVIIDPLQKAGFCLQWSFW